MKVQNHANVHWKTVILGNLPKSDVLLATKAFVYGK